MKVEILIDYFTCIALKIVCIRNDCIDKKKKSRNTKFYLLFAHCSTEAEN